MNSESRQSVLAQFDREQYADWLWRGLRSFYSQPIAERVRAFDFVGLAIMQQESLCEGLAHVYEKYVPSSGKLPFRRAIGDVLREQANNEDAPLDVFQDLIYLLVRTRATESLNSLLPAVGNGLAGKRNPDLLYDTVAALRSLAPSLYAYDAARQLIFSLNFDDGYLFEGIKVLAECDPSRVSATVLEFEPRLSGLRQQSEHDEAEWTAFCDAANECAQLLLALGPQSWLDDLCQHVHQMMDPFWLLKCLLVNILSSTATAKAQDNLWTLRKTLRHLALDAAVPLVEDSLVQGLQKSVMSLFWESPHTTHPGGPQLNA